MPGVLKDWWVNPSDSTNILLPDVPGGCRQKCSTRVLSSALRFQLDVCLKKEGNRLPAPVSRRFNRLFAVFVRL